MAVLVAVLCVGISQAVPVSESKIIDGVKDQLGDLFNTAINFKVQLLTVALTPFHYVANMIHGTPQNAVAVTEPIVAPAAY